MKTKITGPQDFSGQTADSMSVNPAELSGRLSSTFVPTIDDPSQHKAAVRIFRSDDDIIHLSRSAGLKIA